MTGNVNSLHTLEHAAQELMRRFNITAPPVPIESMLQHPQTDMWEEVDVGQLSMGFLSANAAYTPRMSMARLLARHVMRSPWGESHGLNAIVDDTALLHTFARMLIMPQNMMTTLSVGARNPRAVCSAFEVPEAEAALRLNELDLAER